MAKKYKGSLSLEWFNKQKAIVNLDESSIRSGSDIPAPRINWINKDEALFYELIEKEGKGSTPYWVNRDDIRVKEARPLIFQKAFKAIERDKDGTIPGTNKEVILKEINVESDSIDIDNILIKGDNLLALNTLKKHFEKLPESEKVKCIYIDPPYNTGSAFDHYEDNLEHSEWLTMMRDRLMILKDLMKDDGLIFIHLDDKESAYCKILLDEIFGRHNYVNEIILTTNKPFGFKGTSDSLFKQANHIFLYAKNKELIEIKKIYFERDYDTAYNKVFLNMDKPEDEWEWESISLHVAKQKGFKNAKEAKAKLGAEEFESVIAQFALNNSEKVFQAVGVSGGAYIKRKETIKISKNNPGKIIRHPNDDMDYQFIGGRRVIYYKERLVEIDGLKLPGEIITDTWTDISFEGLAHEGKVDFPKSKKPEKLIERIFDIGSDEHDTVLDIFGGSGSTFAVAQKMNRKWVGVEIGNHADTHIIPRLKSVLSGEDQSGISKSIKWKGGGSFKYYHLGESIINVDAEIGKGEFNWKLGKQFIQESLLLSYDFIVQDISVFPAKIFPETDNQPTIGRLTGTSGKSIYGLSTLMAPEDSDTTISNEEVKSIYNTLKKYDDFQSLVIYTNKGIDLAQDTIPEDLDIIKVPHAIFSELER